MSAFLSYLIHDLFRTMSGVTSRPLFGGHALYKDGVIFAIVVDDRLYFKADQFTDFYFIEQGSERFSYRNRGRLVHLPYWEVPAAVLEDPDELARWVERAATVTEKSRRPKSRERPLARAPVSTPLFANTKGIIFGFSGVLVSDAAAAWAEAHISNFAERATAFRSLGRLAASGRINYQEYLERLARTFHATPRVIHRQIEKQLQVDQHMVSLIAMLKKGYRLALLATAHHEFVEPVLRRFHLDRLFATIVISSREQGAGGPSALLGITVQRLGVRQEAALLVERDERTLAAAGTAGIASVSFTGASPCLSDLVSGGIVVSG